jgi:hypothetical protein
MCPRLDQALAALKAQIASPTTDAAPTLEQVPIKRTRKSPRFDPVKSAAKVIAKNPHLVARIKPDGEIEIASSKSAAPAIDHEIDLDATADNHVWNAIEAIRRGGGHGAH